MAEEVKTIARDENCDLYLDNYGQLALVSAQDAYAQIINAKMRTTLGELQLSLSSGLPYFQTVFNNPTYLSIWESAVMDMLNDLPFIKEVTSFSCEVKGNMIQYIAEIQTDEGLVKING